MIFPGVAGIIVNHRVQFHQHQTTPYALVELDVCWTLDMTPQWLLLLEVIAVMAHLS
jgi:hypothetical protein